MDEMMLKQLEKDLLTKIDRILSHPVVDAIHNARLNIEQLRLFALQYYIYCSYFPRFLCACAANIPDDNTRMAIIENIWEEHGSGKLSGSHRVLFEKFALSLGLTQNQLKEAHPIPSTLINVEYLLNMCQDDSFIKSLGALGPGTEFFTSQEYEKIYRGLQKVDGLTEDDLEFWSVHITLDDHHYSDMLSSIRPWIRDEDDARLLKEGAERAIDLEILFWDGLEDHIFPKILK
ncbi:MAG: iron-containing redox enzyme family protein [Saprospiraceae bacterium]|nr:iron-containing redox enzyme family protein [Saprospiraceae bacterium]